MEKKSNEFEEVEKAEVKFEEVKKKIAATKFGGKNPNNRKVKVIDIQNNTAAIYPSMQEAADALKLTSHMPVSRRCRGVITSPLNNRYLFEYYNSEGVTTIESVPNGTASIVA